MSSVRFIEDGHKYIHKDGHSLMSVSAFMDTFKEKTDWKKIAENKAKRMTKEGTPTTGAQLMKQWNKKRDESSKVGTILHTIKENDLLDEEAPSYYGSIFKTKATHTFKDGKHSIPINELENDTIYPELMIFNEYLCGQADKVIVQKKYINIWDYKTDKEIKYKGFSNQWTKAKKLLPPLSHLDECSANIYSLKMSLYMYMLWKANKGRYAPGELIIEHVSLKRDPNNDDIPVLDSNGRPIVLKIEQIKLPYRKKEVEAMLATLKK